MTKYNVYTVGKDVDGNVFGDVALFEGVTADVISSEYGSYVLPLLASIDGESIVGVETIHNIYLTRG